MCFWTVFTSLGVQLFYWSVWKLGKSPEIAGDDIHTEIAEQLLPDQNWRYWPTCLASYWSNPLGMLMQLLDKV